MAPFDIAQIMPMLQAQGMGGGFGGIGPGPLGALQMGQAGPMAGPMAGSPGAPDFNAILQQRALEQNAQFQAMQQQRLAQMADRFGQRTGGAMQFDPSMGMQGMRQQFRDWRQDQPMGQGGMQRPMGFGRPDMGNTAPMVGTAQVGGGMQPGGGQVNAGPAANIYPDRRRQNMSPLGG